MLLITEEILETTTTIEESADGKKNLFIEGIFAQSEVKNRNGRIYPKSILAKEIKRYDEKFIKTARSLGELNHPKNPAVNPERASHLIVSLNENGNDYIGRAKILNTPMGLVVKGLIEGGVNLGVSTRGLGTISEKGGTNFVNEDFRLVTVDVVADPSAPAAFVQGIMENHDWVWDGDTFKEEKLEEAKKLIKVVNKKHLEEMKIKVFENMFR